MKEIIYFNIDILFNIYISFGIRVLNVDRLKEPGFEPLSIQDLNLESCV